MGPHGKHLDEHVKQFRSDSAKAARHGRDLGAERAKFAARWGAGAVGVDAYMNDRAALALEEIGATIAAGEDAEDAATIAAALRELFDPKRAPKPAADLSKQERRASRLEVYSQIMAPEIGAAADAPAGAAEPIRTKYAGEVVFDPARGAWVDLNDEGKRAVLRECVVYDETDPANVAREAETALMRAQDAAPKALGEHFFEFGKALMRIQIGRAPANRGGRRVADLAEVERPFLIGRLGAVATFRPRGGENITAEEALNFKSPPEVAQPIAPPAGVADIILASGGVRPFPRISGLRTCPTLRPDGSILSEDGLDAQTGIVLVSNVTLPPMIDEPNWSDAKAAAAELADLFFETKFENGSESIGLAVAISGILSAVGRPAMDFVPIHAATSPTPGSGKGFTHEVVSLIANGGAAASMNVAKQIEETEKRLTGLLLKGCSSIVIDNANGVLESDLLAQIATQSVIVTRPLGTSTMIEIDNSTMVFVNGNNLRLADDLTRRAVMSVIDTGEERPEKRHFKRDTLAMIRANRGKYVASALTVLRAFMLAKEKGRADSIEQRLSGFGQWSDLVRSALVWCGYADPAASIDRIRENDPVYQSLAEILPAWYNMFGTTPQTVADMVAAVSSGSTGYGVAEAASALDTAFRSHVSHAGLKELDGRKVGMLLQKCKNRIAAGMKLTMVTKTTRSKKIGPQWRVAPANWVDAEEAGAQLSDVVVPLASKRPRF